MLKGLWIWPSRFDFISKKVGQVFFWNSRYIRKGTLFTKQTFKLTFKKVLPADLGSTFSTYTVTSPLELMTQPPPSSLLADLLTVETMFPKYADRRVRIQRYVGVVLMWMTSMKTWIQLTLSPFYVSLFVVLRVTLSNMCHCASCTITLQKYEH